MVSITCWNSFLFYDWRKEWRNVNIWAVWWSKNSLYFPINICEEFGGVYYRFSIFGSGILISLFAVVMAFHILIISLHYSFSLRIKIWGFVKNMKSKIKKKTSVENSLDRNTMVNVDMWQFFALSIPIREGI